MDELFTDELDAFIDHAILIRVVELTLLRAGDCLLVGDTDVN